MRWTTFMALWVMTALFRCGPMVAADTPSLEEIGRMLVKRSEDLDQVDLSYRLDYEFLFPVAGLTPEDFTTNATGGGRYRTVFMGRKRRFDEYPQGRRPSEVIIFDGETTAEIQVKQPQLRARGVAVLLKQGLTNSSSKDCQYCLVALGKPLSDSTQAQAYGKEVFPWILQYATEPDKSELLQLDPQPTLIHGRPCYAVRFGQGLDSYWLDPGHGYAVVRRERSQPHNGKNFLVSRSTASDFRQQGEYWVPYSYEREHYAPPLAKERAGQVYYRMKMTVEQIQIGQVSDEDFKAELIEGAPVFDLDNQRMIENRTSRLTGVGALVAKVNSAHRPWWHWAGMAVVILLVGVAGFCLWKRAAHRSMARSK